MRIGINTLFFIPGKVGGSETYIRNLIAKLSDIDSENEYFIFANRENFNEFKTGRPNFHKMLCPINASFKPGRILWEQFVLPFQTLKYKIDILFSPGYTAPIFIGCKQVVTIHDLNYYYHPDDFSSLELLFWRLLVPLSARAANRVITISKNSKRDIENILKVSPDKVDLIYEAANMFPDFGGWGDENIEKVKKKYCIDGKYILSIAAMHPHKNIHRLIEAYKILKDKYGTSHKLVLVGMKAWASKAVEGAIKGMSLEKDVIFTGWVPLEDIPIFYKGAAVFVFPSLFEGFGIPPLEAMTCGTPVAVSNITSLPEVVGDAGKYFNPYDVEDIASKVYEVITSTALREELIKKGFEQAKKFFWEKTAKQTVDVFKAVIYDN
ncbi:MAG: glycosyltransferase family 4 protein [Deltaproteobacteria bacterium]|nr:glycosyltransferase family 4 protein [Deltaproteobacteria bacterium]